MKKIIPLLFLFLSAATLAQETPVKFTANIKNRTNDSITIRSQAGVVKVLKADAKGKMSGSFSVKPDFYQVTDGTWVAVLYLGNGFDLTMDTDAKMMTETVAFKGKGEKENNFLAKLNLDNKQYAQKLAMVVDPVERNKMIDKMLTDLEQKLADPELDRNFHSVISKQVAGQRQQIAQMMAQAEKAGKMKGQPAPQFDYENFKGGTTKLADLKGKYVYVDVWATWCGPCRQEIPHLQQLEKDYHGKKIEFVSISIDEKKNYDKWRKMVEEKQMGGLQLMADNAWGSAFVQAFGINSIPRFLLIDPKGNVVEADAARPSNPALRTQLDGLLK